MCGQLTTRAGLGGKKTRQQSEVFDHAASNWRNNADTNLPTGGIVSEVTGATLGDTAGLRRAVTLTGAQYADRWSRGNRRGNRGGSRREVPSWRRIQVMTASDNRPDSELFWKLWYAVTAYTSTEDIVLS